MISTHINTCRNCGHQYCCECTEAENWEYFCSVECEEEWKEQEKENK